MGFSVPPPPPRRGASDEEWHEHFKMLRKRLWWTNFRLLVLYATIPITVVAVVAAYLIRMYW